MSWVPGFLDQETRIEKIISTEYIAAHNIHFPARVQTFKGIMITYGKQNFKLIKDTLIKGRSRHQTTLYRSKIHPIFPMNRWKGGR